MTIMNEEANIKSTYKRQNYLMTFDKRQNYYKTYYQANKDNYKAKYENNKEQLKQANKQRTIKNNVVEVVIL